MTKTIRTTTTTLLRARVPSPAGAIDLVAGPNGLCALAFADRFDQLESHLARRFGEVRFLRHADPAGAATRLREFLRGRLDAFLGLDLDTGGTDFQRAVWSALRRIPAGVTWSYADLARAIGSPKSVRAVGGANHANPISIAIPCHRVIGSDGSLVGYGGGMERKRWLLVHEGALLA